VNVQEAKEFKVTVKLEEMPDEIRNGLRPGMSATATITTKTKNNVVAVPLEAIVEKAPSASPSPTVAGTAQPAATTEKPKTLKGVYIIEGNKVRFIEVTTGITGEADIEVTSGVKAGMEIVRGPSRVLKTLKDNMTVKRQVKKAGANANASEGS
jgi:HlyD family secretion protein